MSAKRRASSKSGLTLLLEELTTLLPKALEACPADSESQSCNLIIEKLRTVLLDLLDNCLKCSSGKHIIAVLKILRHVLHKLPATFPAHAHSQALACMVQLLARLPAHQGTLDDQLLEVWCSMAGLAADQSQALLLEMHAGTVDLLLDLEQLLFELSRPAAAVQGEGMPLPLYQGLLCELQCAGELAAQQQQDVQQQQQQQGQLASYVEAHVKDEATWQAYAALALRFLLHLLREFPGQLGPATPCVLVPALGQMLSYCSSEVQELCLNAMALMVIHQSHEGAMVAAVLQHVLWLLECAAGGLIPAAVASPSWQVAAAACVEVCLPALNSLNMLGAFSDRLVQCLCSAAVAQPLQQQQSLWLGLLHEVLLLSSSHAGMAALHLPLVAAAGSSPQAEGVLLQVWQAVGVWAAQPGVKDVVERQVLLLHPSMHAAPASSTEAAGEFPTSPPKKKARKLKQAQLTAEGGFLSRQRPGKGTPSQPSDSGQAAATAAASSPSSQASTAELALQTMQQLLQLQPGTPDAAAIARIVRGIALSLLQQLALRHTASRELEELLVAGPAGAALLSAVGRALAGQPALFVQLAQLVQLAEDQLAVAVAPHVVPWLCQQQLKEPLELLAGKLGLDAARLVLFCSDGVLAERMWFNPEGLAGLVEFVDELVAPDSFVSVVQSMGRRMARCLIEKAGAACFWGAQHTPPPEMLSRARE
ncbi:hypothetical protein OEZ85_002849 [Tetradesmus obliquus]|uniref:Uncharacterized protein n=1 Tax=Tetradesmus obliquus TaxID=3088 RepID=A0ABY8TYT4_TETOB|nr:hypothetical protein OEZ85_002849 [Tetradesmus obliquus]